VKVISCLLVISVIAITIASNCIMNSNNELLLFLLLRIILVFISSNYILKVHVFSCLSQGTFLISQSQQNVLCWVCSLLMAFSLSIDPCLILALLQALYLILGSVSCLVSN